MGWLVKTKNVLNRFKSKPGNICYQLWLEDLGNRPGTVIDFLIDDIFIAGSMEEPSDLPELPWEIIQLPAGSDTYNIIFIKAGELEKLGAVVSVKEI